MILAIVQFIEFKIFATLYETQVGFYYWSNENLVQIIGNAYLIINYKSSIILKLLVLHYYIKRKTRKNLSNKTHD